MNMPSTAFHQNQKKNNKGFMILSFLGILFVIDAHLGSSIGFFTDIFPYDSFFMPMFVFISGYFYRESHSATYRDVLKYIIHKIKTLLCPYLFWVFAYGVFTCILRSLGLIKFSNISIATVLVEIVSSGWSYGFNDPSWFVPMLFCICVFYCLLRKVFGKLWNDAVIMFLLIFLGAWAISVSKTDFNTARHYMLIKVSFFLQFYHMGLVFKKRIEPIFDRINTVLLCIVATIFNIILISIYGQDISFPNCATMGNFRTNNLLLPLLTSISGIAFWLKISKALIPVLGCDPIVNYISANTFSIMTHHLTFKWIFNGFLLVGKKCGIKVLSSVDSSKFVSDPWYFFNQQPWACIACFLFIIAASFIFCHILQRIRQTTVRSVPVR